MTGLWGVMDETVQDEIFTYECSTAEEAAGLFLDDPEATGTVVRVWVLGRHPAAFVRTKSGDILKIDSPGQVQK